MTSLAYILGVVGAVWVIYDVWAVNTKLSSGGKIVWTVFAILFNVVTAIVYFFIGRK